MERKKYTFVKILFIKGANVGLERWLNGQKA